jgi:hypothetical protein
MKTPPQNAQSKCRKTAQANQKRYWISAGIALRLALHAERTSPPFPDAKVLSESPELPYEVGSTVCTLRIGVVIVPPAVQP